MSEIEFSAEVIAKATRAETIRLYADAILAWEGDRLMHGPPWSEWNAAIIERFGAASLITIKKEAWKLVDAEKVANTEKLIGKRDERAARFNNLLEQIEVAAHSIRVGDELDIPYTMGMMVSQVSEAWLIAGQVSAEALDKVTE